MKISRGRKVLSGSSLSSSKMLCLSCYLSQVLWLRHELYWEPCNHWFILKNKQSVAVTANLAFSYSNSLLCIATRKTVENCTHFPQNECNKSFSEMFYFGRTILALTPAASFWKNLSRLSITERLSWDTGRCICFRARVHENDLTAPINTVFPDSTVTVDSWWYLSSINKRYADISPTKWVQPFVLCYCHIK